MTTPIYDERVRDNNLRGQALHEGLSDEMVSEILLETTRSFFLTEKNFTTRVLRERTPTLLWSNDDTLTQIRILRDIDWNPRDMGRTPEIVIRSAGTRWTSTNNTAIIDTPQETLENPDYINHIIVGRSAIWVISPVSEEAWNIAWELGLFYAAFSQPLIREYGFMNIQPAGVSNPTHIKERKDYWGSVVTMAASWQITQELIEQKPVLAEINATRKVGGDDF